EAGARMSGLAPPRTNRRRLVMPWKPTDPQLTVQTHRSAHTRTWSLGRDQSVVCDRFEGVIARPTRWIATTNTTMSVVVIRTKPITIGTGFAPAPGPMARTIA